MNLTKIIGCVIMIEEERMMKRSDYEKEIKVKDLLIKSLSERIEREIG